MGEHHLTDLLQFQGEDVPRSFISADIASRSFDEWPMPDIDVFVRVFGSALMFVKSENDPWSAEPFQLGPGTRDSFSYLVPSGNHGARIAQLPAEKRVEAIAAIRRWAGLPEKAPATVVTPGGTEMLDRVDEVQAAGPRRVLPRQ